MPAPLTDSWRLATAGLALIALAPAAASPLSVRLTAHRGVLSLGDGERRMTSADLVGASLIVRLSDENGATSQLREVRIDSVTEAADAPGVLLHELTVAAPDGSRQAFCTVDSRGRNAAYALRGRLNRKGRFVADRSSFFFACTSGAVGKCVLWGYDPWTAHPRTGTLLNHYQTCLVVARADYLGSGQAHTRDGTVLDLADNLGVRRWSSDGDDRFTFEAGWASGGAICINRPRWPDLVDLEDLASRRPALLKACTPAEAARRGALLFTRVLEQMALTSQTARDGQIMAERARRRRCDRNRDRRECGSR